ncbi:MAG: hypothetical protein M1436_08075 [Acidobacteria bacterium]|nr:hypothetical protein [Acidobacteriota bacterium]
MSRSNIFLKLEVEHDEEDSPQKIGEEICRRLMKIYGVRSAEISSFTAIEE